MDDKTRATRRGKVSKLLSVGHNANGNGVGMDAGDGSQMQKRV
jgi:hypothetical protein